MNEIDDYILKQRAKYHKIKSIECMALSGEKIFFNRHGLNHLVRKEGHNRTFCDQKRRFGLLKYCKVILEDKDASVEYRFLEKGKTKAEFWGITSEIHGRRIRVVVRRINGGNLIFLSIMNFR